MPEQRCVFSPQAERDLEEIADYIAADNPSRALSFIRELSERCQNLVSFPEAAPLRPDLGANIRLVPYKRYAIFYTVQADAVRIERILGGGRNPSDIFKSNG